MRVPSPASATELSLRIKPVYIKEKLSPFRSSSPTWSTTGRCGCGGGPRPRATRRAAPWARGGASRASPSTDVPPHRTAPPSTSTRPRPPPAPPPPPPLHLLPRLALEGGHGLPAQLLRGRRHLALRVIPRRLPTRPLVAPHTHIPHRTPGTSVEGQVAPRPCACCADLHAVRGRGLPPRPPLPACFT